MRWPSEIIVKARSQSMINVTIEMANTSPNIQARGPSPSRGTTKGAIQPTSVVASPSVR